MADNRPPKRVRYPTGRELRALEQKEAGLKAQDKADGGNRYRTFRQSEDAAFSAAQAEDRRNGHTLWGWLTS